MLFNDNRMLLFDTRHIESMENVSLKMNPPAKRGACLSVEKGWEVGHCRVCNIIRFNDEYRLYHTVRYEGGKGMAFAVSQDGVNWERPKLGATDYQGSKDNNLVVMDCHDFGETCVFVDPSAPDSERVKCICHHPWYGLWCLVSPDGIHFTMGHEGYILRRGTDNNMTVFWDESIGKYRVYLRGGDKSRDVMGWAGSRSVVYTETEDILQPLVIDEFAPDPHSYGYERPGIDGKLVRPRPGINKELPTVMRMDEMDPPQADLYQAAAVHYAPDAYVAFPTLYFHYPGPPEGFINDGYLDLQFASSRDGRLWRRDFRGSYVRLDMTGGAASKQMHMAIGMVPHTYTLSQYYFGAPWSHGEGRTPDNRAAKGLHEQHMGDAICFRAEQRIDGFVSANIAYTGGSLLTKPFTLQSDQLRLNIDTSASGVAWAALLDENGLELKRCKLADSDRIQGNDTQYTLSWSGKNDLSQYVGRQVRLLVKGRSCKVFAIHP